jgi:hypothetical protein
MKEKMIYPDLTDGGDLNYTAIALSALRRVPVELRMHMQQAGTWQDIVCWASVAAVEGWVEGYDARDCYNAAQRYIYRGLRNDGYSRSRVDGMRYIRREYDEVSVEMMEDYYV